MLLIHYLYVDHKSWTRAKTMRMMTTTSSMSISAIISMYLLSCLLCLQLTDGRSTTMLSTKTTIDSFIPSSSSHPKYMTITTSSSSSSSSSSGEDDEDVVKLNGELPIQTTFLTHEQQQQQQQQQKHSMEKDVMEKMREGILTELGLNIDNYPNSIPQQSQANISREEYVRAYTQYMFNVRLRRNLERTQFYGAKERRKNGILRIQDFHDLTTTNEIQSPPGLLENFIPKRQELKFDIQLEKFKNYEPRIAKAILILPSNCFLENGSNDNKKWKNEFDLTKNITSWLLQQQKLQNNNNNNFTMITLCFKNATTTFNNNNYNNNNNNNNKIILKIITRHHSQSQYGKYIKRQKRSSIIQQQQQQQGGDELLGSPPTLVQKYQNKDSSGKSRDCDKTRHGKTCCRRSLKINFDDLQVRDVVLEPKEFDAFMCMGRCNAKKLPYATTHAMFQHTLHQTKGKKIVPRPCCTPARLTSLDVIHTIPGSHMLQVTILTNAIVQECGCS